MNESATCPWCASSVNQTEERNITDRQGGKLCVQCGHRADLPREACDCKVCLTFPRPQRRGRHNNGCGGGYLRGF